MTEIQLIAESAINYGLRANLGVKSINDINDHLAQLNQRIQKKAVCLHATIRTQIWRSPQHSYVFR